MYEFEEIESQKTWEKLCRVGKAHPLQEFFWGEHKAKYHWHVKRFLLRKSGENLLAAQILYRKVPIFKKNFAYLARGPIVFSEKIMPRDYEIFAENVRKTLNTISILLETNREKITLPRAFKKSKNSILENKTLILDLKKNPAELQSAMAKKTRQYIRKAEKNGVEISLAATAAEFAAALKIYEKTAARANFGLYAREYYQDLFENFLAQCPLFVAKIDGKIHAFLWLATSENLAFELYGGVDEIGQNAKANYFLKWRAILFCQEKKMEFYDLNGLLNDGISNFKKGFSDHENILASDYEFAPGILGWAFSSLLPAGKRFLRKFKKVTFSD